MRLLNPTIRTSVIACTLLLSLCLLQIVSGVLIVTPKDLNVTSGDNVRLNCSTDSGKPVNWQFGKQLNKMTDVYINGEGLVDHYRRLGRYSVGDNSTVGLYDLRIIDATFEDAGYYLCSEPTGKDDAPHARLLVSGIESSGVIHSRKNAVFAINGVNVKLEFSTCKKGPFYITHIGIGADQPTVVSREGNLLDTYAAGRFNVQRSTDELIELTIENAQTQDAGIFICFENLGYGKKHAINLVILDSTPECLLSNDSRHLNTPGLSTEVTCAVNYTGRCVPLLSWRFLNSSGTWEVVSSGSSQFQEKPYLVQSTSVIPADLNGQMVCFILQPLEPRDFSLQCNVSTGNDQTVIGDAIAKEAQISRWIIALLIGLGVGLMVAIIILIICLCLKKKEAFHYSQPGQASSRARSWSMFRTSQSKKISFDL